MDTKMQAYWGKKAEHIDELNRTKIDREKVNRIHSETKRLNAETMDLRLEGMLKIREILTPEQSRKMYDEMQKKREEFKGKWGRDLKTAKQVF